MVLLVEVVTGFSQRNTWVFAELLSRQLSAGKTMLNPRIQMSKWYKGGQTPARSVSTYCRLSWYIH